MKRNPFQPILTVLLSVGALAGQICTAPLSYAYDVETSAVDPNLLPVGTEINSKRYWSVSEMAEASELINTKRQEFCQGDSMCEEELSWQQMDELGSIYRALDPFENIRFMLTYVNPSTNTLKFLYHDENKMLSRMMGEVVRHDIASIYAVWVEESLGGITTTSSNWLAYGQRAPYHLGSAEEVEAATHLLFDESEAELGSGWFTPNVEREYQVTDSNLLANTTAQIHYSLNATGDGGHSHGTISYSSCVNSPDYTEGMECRMMYAEDGSYAYLPFTPTIQTDSGFTIASTEAEPSGSEQSSSNSESPVAETTNSDATAENPSTGYGNAAISTTAESTGSSVAITATATGQKVIGAPDTGATTREESGEGKPGEFPWWTVFLFSAIFLIFAGGLIWPLFVHSNEKNG